MTANGRGSKAAAEPEMANMARPITQSHHNAGTVYPRRPLAARPAAGFMNGDHGPTGVKTGSAGGVVAAKNCNQPFQSFTAAWAANGPAAARLLFRACAATSASNFPTWRLPAR
jgi:hypothetical protein